MSEKLIALTAVTKISIILNYDALTTVHIEVFIYNWYTIHITLILQYVSIDESYLFQ